MVGRSGSGKSSLMAMIGGLSRPDAGSIVIDGTDIWSLDDDALARFRNQAIGYVFQFASLLPTLRAIDNVALPALLRRRADRAGIAERAASLLTSVGLGSHFDAYPSEMSAGEQRRAAIARALDQCTAAAARRRTGVGSGRAERTRGDDRTFAGEPRRRCNAVAGDAQPCAGRGG